MLLTETDLLEAAEKLPLQLGEGRGEGFAMKKKRGFSLDSFSASPHPNPLPQGEGTFQQPGGTTIRFAKVSDANALAELRYALRSSTGRATEPRSEFVARCQTWMEARLRPGERW